MLTNCKYKFPLEWNEKLLFLLHKLVSTLPRNVTRNKMMSIIYQAVGFAGEGVYNEEGITILQTVLEENHMNAVDIMEKLQQPCNEMIIKCRLEDKLIPCEEIFKSSLGQYGYCCAFNNDEKRLYIFMSY